MRLRKRAWARLGASFFSGGFVTVWCLSGVVATHMICHNDRWDVGTWDPGEAYTLEEVIIPTHDGLALSGWFVDGGTDRAVVWASGINANRRNGLRHAAYYLDRGFSVLLIDLRGTGQSDRVPVSLGWHERHDLAASVAWLRDRGHDRVGAHGHSLGAATIIYSLLEVDDYAFIALESSYDTIDSALRNRLAMFHLPAFLGWPTTFFTEWYADVRSADLRPVDHIALSRVPTLIMAGDAEPELPVRDSLALYEACQAPLKRFHLFPGHRHQNHARVSPEAWEALMDGFLRDAGLFEDTSTTQQDAA